MNLLDSLLVLGNNLPDYFTLETLMSLGFKMYSDQEQKDPLHPLGLYSDPNREELLSTLHQQNAQCILCNRCNNRSKVVIGEGPANAKVFIIGSSPNIMDDRTGIPFSGLSEIRASSCTTCVNYETCYNPSNMFSIPCEYKPSGKDQVALKIGIDGPGRVMVDALTNKSISYRQNWHTMLDKMVTDQRQRERFSDPVNLYVTYLEKCLPSSDEDTSSPECWKWLETERQISQAKVTLCLGSDAATVVRNKESNLLELINTLEELPIYGKTLYYYCPKEIYSCRETNPKYYNELVEGLLTKIRQALEICNGRDPVFEEVGDDQE